MNINQSAMPGQDYGESVQSSRSEALNNPSGSSGSVRIRATRAAVKLGGPGFRYFRTSNVVFVDKSSFIKDFIDGSPFQVILRPRRFGKSLNLSMLEEFFSDRVDECDQRKLFEGLEILSHRDICEKHMGKYCVVYIDFKTCSASTWQSTLMDIRNSLILSIEPFWDDIKYAIGRRLGNGKPHGLAWEFVHDLHEIDLEAFLLAFIQSLNIVYGRRVVVLVDEYDTPLNVDFSSDFDRDRTERFFTQLYLHAFKTDDAPIEMVCLMGVAEMKGSNILSALNNLKCHSIATERYAASFGFTDKEIKGVLTEHMNMSVEAATDFMEKPGGLKHWYNGYRIGNASVVNPWSLMSCLYENGRLDSYWCQTQSSEALFRLCKATSGFADSVAEIFPKLLPEGDGPYPWMPVEKFSPQLNIRSVQTWSPTQVLHFLCMSGYLTYRTRADRSTHELLEGEVCIPNKELHQEWQLLLAKLSGVPTYVDLCQCHNAIVSALTNFDEVAIIKTFEERLEDLSSSARDLECVYQVFIAGILSFVGRLQGWRVLTEVGAGSGSADMIVESSSQKLSIIFEFKKNSTPRDGSAERQALNALQQVRLSRYYMGISESHKIMVIGCVFVTRKPRRSVKMAVAHLPRGTCVQRDKALDKHIGIEQRRLEESSAPKRPKRNPNT